MLYENIDEYNISNIRSYHNISKFIKDYAEDDGFTEPLLMPLEGSGYISTSSFSKAIYNAIKRSPYKNFLNVSRKDNLVTLRKVYCQMVSTRNLQLL